MASKTIIELPPLSAASANTQNTVFAVYDKITGTTRQFTLAALDTAIGTASANAQSTADGAFAKANSANVTAQAAYNQANTDFTTISTTAGVHGNAIFVPIITLAANGRVSSITNTAITGFANTTFANGAFSTANSAYALAITANTVAAAAYTQANSGTTLAQNAYNFANTITSSPGAYAHANGAFDFANTTANVVLTFGATTVLDVSANSSSAYVFSQYTGLNNPNVSTFSATTLGFNLNPLSGSHPFHIRLGDNSADFDTGLVHISSTGTLSYGSAAQGKTSGTLLWRIPHTSVGNYKYRCSAHPSTMIGNLNVANTANIYFAYSS